MTILRNKPLLEFCILSFELWIIAAKPQLGIIFELGKLGIEKS